MRFDGLYLERCCFLWLSMLPSYFGSDGAGYLRTPEIEKGL